MRQTIRPTSLSTDRPANEIALDETTLLSNIQSVDGMLCQARPFESVFGTLSYAPRFLLPNQDATKAYWIYASDLNVGVFDGAAHFNITPVGLSDASALTSPFTGGTINQLPVLNNKADGPFYWDQNTAAVMVTLPGWPAGELCNAMRVFGDFLIGMNFLITGPERVADLLRWSDAAPQNAVPTNWTASTSSQAGEVTVSFNAGALVDGRQLGDRFYVYKTTSAYLLELIGGAFVFKQRPVFSTFGLLSRNCVEEWRGRHICLADGDVVMHDGVTVVSIIRERLRREIFDNMDGQNYENSFLAMSKQNNEIYICRPKTGETYPSEAFVLSLEDLKLGHTKLITTGTPHAVEGLVDVATSTIESIWSDKTTQWNNDPNRWNQVSFSRTANFICLADYAGDAVHQIGSGADQAGVTLAATIEREGIDLGEPNRRKYIRALWLDVDGPLGQTVQVQVGASESAELSPSYGPVQNFVIGTDRFVEGGEVSGYFLAYRVASSGVLTWRLPKMELDFEPMGEH